VSVKVSIVALRELDGSENGSDLKGGETEGLRLERLECDVKDDQKTNQVSYTGPKESVVESFPFGIASSVGEPDCWLVRLDL